MKSYKNGRILHDSCPKNHQSTRIFMIFARKINKIPEFYTIFARKNVRILHNNWPKNIFWAGQRGTTRATLPPSPTSMVQPSPKPPPWILSWILPHYFCRIVKFGEDNIKPRPNYYKCKIFSTAVTVPCKLEILLFEKSQLASWTNEFIKTPTNQRANKHAWSLHLVAEVVAHKSAASLHLRRKSARARYRPKQTANMQ